MQVSIWEKESFFAERDLIIVGAGLCGLWCAHHLIIKNPTLKILIVDRGIIPSGASTRNAGFACFGSPTELLHDAEVMGAEQMWQIAEMRYKGIQKIKQHFSADDIDYEDCGGFECLQNSKHDIEALGERLLWLNAGLQAITGVKETFVWANDKMKSFGLSGFDAMIENKLEGALHSGKLVMALTKKIQSLGVDMLTGIDVHHYEERDSTIILTTKQNISFTAKKILVCSNAFTAQFLTDFHATPARGQIVVTSPIKDLPLRGTFHFDEGFYYFRNIGNRLLLGGARNKCFDAEATTNFETTTIIQEELEHFIKIHLLPSQPFDIEYRWSGIMGFTEDKQPMVKHISDKVTAIVACNGMGVALTPVIAEQLQL
ncbi:NAD(P)/FAD-dependent oxidoreductase [Ilyomonas limi]|nr:FAD-dependent oxidoreductase [Ilyomonas limi]